LDSIIVNLVIEFMIYISNKLQSDQ